LYGTFLPFRILCPSPAAMSIPVIGVLRKNRTDGTTGMRIAVVVR
jgi:hypothetical protein